MDVMYRSGASGYLAAGERWKCFFERWPFPSQIHVPSMRLRIAKLATPSERHRRPGLDKRKFIIALLTQIEGLRI